MQEKNRHILEKAISELPTYEPPSFIWKGIERKLSEKETVADDINKESLSQYEPKPDLWDNIEKELNKNAREQGKIYLTKAILDIPLHTPPAELWVNIEKKIETPKIRFIKKWTYPVSIAASLLFIVSSYWYLKIHTYSGEKISISYSQEEVDIQSNIEQPFAQEGIPATNDDKVLELVKAYCLSIPDVCKNPYLNNLLEQYKDLKTTQEKLLQEAIENNNEYHIQKALIKVEKEKTRVAKKVIQYLI